MAKNTNEIKTLRDENARLRALLDPERIISACVPGGSICDPQEVADALREYSQLTPDVTEAQDCHAPSL